MPKPEDCPHCEGTGTVDCSECGNEKDCDECGGSGVKEDE